MDKKSKKVVIIEDERAMKNALCEAFSKNQFACFSAVDGKAGLGMALEEKPDLVILDILMPVMDGSAFMKELRKDSWGAKVPVLILTNLSLGSGELVRTIVETSPEYFLVKSDWTLSEIVKKANEIMSLPR